MNVVTPEKGNLPLGNRCHITLIKILVHYCPDCQHLYWGLHIVTSDVAFWFFCYYLVKFWWCVPNDRDDS